MADIFNIITSLISSYGYFGLFMAAFIETIFPPIPSELIFPLGGFVAFKSNFSYFETFMMSLSGAIGATMGSAIIYFISLKVGRLAIVKMGKYVFVNEKKIKNAEEWFEKYGIYAVFLGRMAPGVRELISVPAGIARMPFIKFLVFTFLGSLVWSSMLVFTGYVLGNSWNSLSESVSDYFSYITVIIFLGIGIVLIIYLMRRRNKISSPRR